MRDFKAIIKELKIHLADGKKIKVLDKEIALLLGMSQARFATIKKRNVTPYEELLLLCERDDFSCSEIFFN